MKVLVVRKIKQVAGGIDRSLVKAIPPLQEKGIEIAFLSANSGYIIPELQGMGVEVFVPKEDLDNLDIEWQNFAQKIIEEYQPDLIYLKQLDIIVSLAPLIKDIPMVGAIHSRLLEWISDKEREDFQAVIPLLGAIHAVGYQIEQELRSLGASDITHVFSPVEAGQYISSARLAPRDPQLLFVGRADTRKGLDILIQSLPAVVEQFPQSRLTVIGQTGVEIRERGGGKDRPLAQKIGVDHLIDWLGVRDHQFVLEKMSQSDLLVSSSRYEGVPGVILESHSLALPVVATSASAEAMLWGRAGLVVPEDNPFLLAESIVADLRDPERLLRAEQNRRTVLEKYSPNQLVSNISNSFGKVLEEN